MAAQKEPNIFIQVLMTLWGFWAVLVFIISWIFVIPPYFIIFNFTNKSKVPFKGHVMGRFWSKFLFAGFLIRYKVKGREYIKPDQEYVFVCNHRSQLDIPMFAIACKNCFRFLSKIEVLKIPVIGSYVVRRMYITFDRKKREDQFRSYKQMQDSLLKEKISIMIFPEGTRNRTSEPLIGFKDGAFRLAIDTRKPIAVLTILNSGEFSTPNKFMQLKPGIMKAIWTEPIPTSGMTLEDIPKLKEMVKQRMNEVLAHNSLSLGNK